MERKYAILIVDDELANLQKLKRTFLDKYVVHEASGGEEALSLLRREKVAAIITDQKMPGMSGVEFLRRSLEVSPDSVRIILTGYTDVEDLMDAINKGHVHQYITKPWEPFALRETVKRELESWQLRKENVKLSSELQKANELLAKENLQLKREVEVLRETGNQLVYQSRSMEELLNLLDRVVKTDSTVLIQGETGTGKELMARYIHDRSDRNQEAFLPVNCGAIPPDLVESTFFGHKKGSFTGATSDRKGYFELANKGTLFLDEIGESPVDLQVKLLRVLQEGRIFPVGAQKEIPVDVRIIASTNKNLRQMVDEASFRQDLFFRLNVFSVLVPPLRARRDDIDVLTEFFLERISDRMNKTLPGFEENAMNLMRSYDWPGNVRELENEVERLVILCDIDHQITSDMLSERIRYGQSPGKPAEGLKEQLAQLEKTLILNALRHHHDNKSHAAEALGITRQTVIAKLKQYQNS